MAAVAFIIEPDELRGLTALAALGATNGGASGSATSADVISEARALLHAALSEKLTRAGLPWAPSEEAVRRHAAPAAEPAAEPASEPPAEQAAEPAPEPALEPASAPVAGAEPAPARVGPARRQALQRDVAYALAVAVAVVLWGGYARGWAWTGLQANGQLWDWLNLLLLPVVVGVIPLWIQYRRYIGRTRRAVYAAVIVAWTGFMIAGYLIPIGWTGFRGQTLWNWIQLLLLPAALAITVALTSRHKGPVRVLRSLRPYQMAIVAVLAAGWAVTVIGGYALRWMWTGYADNTLWDWLQLLLLPAVFPTILLPALLSWITGDAAGRAVPRPRRPGSAEGPVVAAPAPGARARESTDAR